MTLLSTFISDISFFDVCAALLVVGATERALLRFAPDTWLDATGLSS